MSYLATEAAEAFVDRVARLPRNKHTGNTHTHQFSKVQFRKAPKENKYEQVMV